MPKINQEEYEVLKELDDKWKWIARDDDYGGLIFCFRKKPHKDIRNGEWGPDATQYKYLGEYELLFQFIQWEDEEPYNIAELIEEYERYEIGNIHVERKHPMFNCNRFNGFYNANIAIWDRLEESEETEVKKNIEWLKNEVNELPLRFLGFSMLKQREEFTVSKDDVLELINQLDEPEPKNITLQVVTDKLWELPLNNRKLWLARLNDEFQEGYIVPLGLKTTDGEEQYLTYNGSYFASRRNRYLQQTFATLEEIPEFYRDLAERVL